jgi:tetratricopeptide (TPR) repeat protein
MPESSAPQLEQSEILDLLTSIVDKSLAIFDDATGRYRLLETVRQYARDRSLESERADLLRNRHLEYFENLAHDRFQSMVDGLDPDQRWNDEFATEQDNIRTALQWSLADVGLIGSGFKLAGSLQWFWIARAMSREEARWLGAALDISKGDPSLRLARARASIQYWWARYFIGQMEGAFEGLEECLAECRELNDAFGIGRALHGLGLLQAEKGQVQCARDTLAEALLQAEAASDKYGLATLLNDTGEFERALGFSEAAGNYYERSIASSIDWNPGLSTFARGNLAVMAADEGDTDTATQLLLDVLSDCLRFGYEKPLPGCITAVALLISSDRPQGAARLIGAAEAFHDLTGTYFEAADVPAYEKAMASVLERLSAKEYKDAKAEGAGMDWRIAGRYALDELQRDPQQEG